jgi:glycosyltransferase involved in cell wall biosynthesis
MGAQAYEQAITVRASAALVRAGHSGAVQEVVARSLRSPLHGNRRLPMGWLSSARPSARRLLGHLVYPRRALVHRMDLVLPPPPGPDVVTLHDLVSWDFADESTPVRAAAAELRRADAVICVSEFTATQASERLGLTDVTVVHNGVDERYFDPPSLDAAWLARHGIPGPFVLYAGGSSARKNLPGLAAAWRLASRGLPDWHLVLAGPRSHSRTTLFGGLPRVVHLGRVEDAVMPSLVAAAGCVVVPSLYEGFGLPALEGMAAGVPVVSSNRSSLPEVVGDAGILVDPAPDALAEGLLAVASSSVDLAAMTERGRQRAQHFTWERAADGHAAVWASLL